MRRCYIYKGRMMQDRCGATPDVSGSMIDPHRFLLGQDACGDRLEPDRDVVLSGISIAQRSTDGLSISKGMVI